MFTLAKLSAAQEPVLIGAQLVIPSRFRFLVEEAQAIMILFITGLVFSPIGEIPITTVRPLPRVFRSSVCASNV